MKKLLLLSLMAIAIKSQAQNVGIGTATPAFAYKLHVHSGDASTDASIGITNGLTTIADGRGARLRMLGSDFSLQNNEVAGKLSFITNANTRMTILPNGKVGIGVNPVSTALLEVNGDTKINGEVNRPSTGSANMVPIAYGTISSTGAIQSGSGNFSVTRDGLNYLITIVGESYFYINYTTIATVSAPSNTPEFISVGSLSGALTVSIYNLAGTQISEFFNFVTYKQ